MNYNLIIDHISKTDAATGFPPTALELVRDLNITYDWATVCLNDYAKLKRDAATRV